jgi:hypothetical protein
LHDKHSYALRRRLLDPEVVLSATKLDEQVFDAANFDCGYGTLALPA